MTSRARSSLAVAAALAGTVFVVLTVILAASGTPGLDRGAFDLARNVRSPALVSAAKLITHLGLFVFVAPMVLLAGGILFRAGERRRASALVIGGGLAWVSVWVTKWAVDRPRPAAPLVHTVGQSFPSGHAANAVGWSAATLALAVMVSSPRARSALLVVGVLLTVLVGLSRIYLRAHYASDVIAGVALSVMVYAAAALAVIPASPASGDAIRDENGQLAS